MLSDITIGQYYPIDSWLHRLDPRVKLLGVLIYIICIFSFRGITGLVLITGFLICAIKVSRVPFFYMVRGLRVIVILLVITAAFNLFFTRTGTVLLSLSFIRITDTGLKNAVLIAFRLIYLILGTSLLTLSTTPNQLTDGLEYSLRFLGKIHVPVHAIAMMMSIALRFIPILTEETDKIMKAQTARGADFSSGGIFRRVKSMVPILVPLFVSAFRRADDLAMAMEARCYGGGEGRTKMKPLRYRRRDAAAIAIEIVFLAAVILTRTFLADALF